MLHLSASGLWRAELCSGSVVIEPRAPEVHQDAVAGVAEHRELELAVPDGYKAEVSVAVDVLTGEGRVLGQGLGRKYVDLKPSEIPGTMDRLKVDPPRARIRDHKSGYGYIVTAPRESLQLLHNAIGATRALGLNEAVIEIHHTESGEVEDATLDALDMAAGLGRIRKIWEAAKEAEAAQARGEPVPVVTGEHCWRCEAFRHCPAQLQMASTFQSGAIAKLLPTLELTTPAVAEGWKALKKAKKILGEVEKIYRAYGAGELVPLGGGVWLGKHPVEKKQLNPAVARQVIAEAYGQGVAEAACDFETSAAAIERALKPVIAAKKLAGEKVTMTGKEGLLPALMTRIDLAGGILRKTTEVVEEFNPKKDAEAA
jgi:hypothetical protein